MADSNLLVPVQNGRPPKAYDRLTGIQTIRGGQLVGEGFFASVFNSFYNIIYHFWGLTFAILGLFILLSEYGTSSGPLEMLLAALIKFIKDPHALIFLKTIATFLVWVLGYAITYKYVLAYTCILLVPPIVKPSARNFLFAVVLIVLAFIHYITIAQVLALALLFYLFVMLRTPAHKFFILAAAVLVFGLGFTTDPSNLSTKIANFNFSALHQPLTFDPQPVPDVESIQLRRMKREFSDEEYQAMAERVNQLEEALQAVKGLKPPDVTPAVASQKFLRTTTSSPQQKDSSKS